MAVSLEDLRGKVVLVDFWTYTCINCIRTLPYVTSWYDRYKDEVFITLDKSRLYDLVKLPYRGKHLLKIEFVSPGIRVFAFTFD